MIITFQLAQSAGQVFHLRFAEGQCFLKLVAACTVVAELRMQFVTTDTRALFGTAVRTNANILQFTL